MFTVLIFITALLVYASVQVKFEEDFTRFFPKKSASVQNARLFSRIKIKDKIVILFKSRDTLSIVPSDELISAAELFEKDILSRVGESHIKESRLKVDATEREKLMDYIYDNLPLFLTSKDYQKFDSLTSATAIDGSLKRTLASLLSPAGYTLSSYFKQDPLGLASNVTSSLQQLQLGMEYNLIDNHIFSQDNSTLLYIITPKNGSSNISENEKLVSAIEKVKTNVESHFPKIDIMFMGGPTVGVFNARQIKADTLITLTIALLVIVFLLYLAFRKISSVIYLLLPALFGVLFSLAFISFVKEGISAIAVGAGAAVMGIALSYSIHILSHLKHVKSIEQLIEELTYPLTVGSFTTIGAFLGLLFTQSSLLRDFGLFSALTLIGTTLFSLVFLPHFLKIDNQAGSNKVIEWIEKFSSTRFEKKRWLVLSIILLFIVGLIFSPKVTFQSDMMKLNYEPQSIKIAEKTFSNQFKSNESRVLLLSVGKTLNDAIKVYSSCDSTLENLQKAGVGIGKTSISNLLINEEEQVERIKRWNTYWNLGKKEAVMNTLKQKSDFYGFSPDAFTGFKKILDKNYSLTYYDRNISVLPNVLKEWLEVSDTSSLLITQLFVNEKDKPKVYDEIAKNDDIVVIDRAHFAGVWATAIKEDFNFILALCTILVFVTLLISYGRLELAILAFIPMVVSWIIILGLMALFKIPFNIINILLSSFIFGIGDDFSIFVLDGLQNEFARKKMILASHKSAIFFSTFTVIIGMGALLFARHPALQSISMISVLGMVAVWGVAYTIQPILFRFFIGAPVEKGLPPYTISGILLMLLTFSAFITGCLLAAVYISITLLLPIKGKTKREIFHWIIKKLVFLPVRLSPTVKIFRENPYSENFCKPAVIIANHQSFIDILMLLSLSPKIIMMTNQWVWNSPFFGHIVRYAGFLHYKDGIEHHLDELRKSVANGYSVLIFPEGTRSADLSIHRFHKGAFLLAQELSLDILPILIYGNGNLVSKQQPFYVKHGVIGYYVLPRISFDNLRFGDDYQQKSKLIAKYMRDEYQMLRARYDTPQNHFFYYAVLANYIYKGPVLEWYMRIKMKMEKGYRYFHELIPLDATITDVGCGYGPLCYTLGLLSGKRVILGIDYDNEKIEIAQNCYSSNSRISFITADATIFEMPKSDVFILNDILHYLTVVDQEKLLGECVSKIEEGGMVIVRDGDSGKHRNHRITRLSEWFSINLIGFNKAKSAPCFTNRGVFETWADKLGCSMEVVRNDKITSNTIYILKRKSFE